MKTNHIIGTGSISLYCTEFLNSKKSIELMHKAKISLVRMGVHYPFADEKMDKLTDKYTKAVKDIKKLADGGIKSMGSYEYASSYRFDQETGKKGIVRRTPLWVGEFHEDIFYERVKKGAEFVARELKENITWWQVSNEPDIPVFMGGFTPEQNIRYLRAVAKGIKKGNPQAKCGINLAGVGDVGSDKPGIHRYAMEIIDQLYKKEGLFDYLGIDAYFGTWIPGEPFDWIPYIDEAAKASGKPIIINEWGYSTLQRGKPHTDEEKKGYFNNQVCLEKDWDATVGGSNAKWRGLEHSEELQAEYIKECVKIFSEHPNVIGNMFFQWQDQANCWQCGEPDCPAECAWGCIRADGTPKLGYYALVEANNIYFD